MWYAPWRQDARPAPEEGPARSREGPPHGGAESFEEVTIVNGRISSGGRAAHIRAGRGLLLVWLAGAMLVSWSQAGASLTHEPNYTHIKVIMIDYRYTNTPEELEFLSDHADLVIGDLEGYGDSPQLTYTNYYCMYVGNREYEDARQWAARQGVDFEAFFIHYAEETEARFGSETRILPAGSRVPTYNWYGSEGDLTKAGARVVTNPGNPNYRAWKLDSLEQQMGDEHDGIFVDNTSFDHLIQPPTILRGGSIAEYPTDTGLSYGTALLTLFAEFSARFGPARVQVPNVSMYPDDPRVYPYVWGFYREAWNQPQRWQYYATIEKNIADSTAAGVVANALGGFAAEPRYEIPLLANFYLVKNDTCYFFPFLRHVKDEWGIDPRLNQWFGAVAYDVGQPVGDRYTLDVGIDPSSPLRDTMTATVEKVGYSYRLTDPSKSWTDEQWRNLWVLFPSGYAIKAYHSGADWISVYAPEEVPSDGVYRLGSSTYGVLAREYENALIVFRPMGANQQVGDLSAVDVPLPATAGNPSGRYFVLDRDGLTGATAVTSISLRGADGAILVNDSRDAGTASLYLTIDRTEVVSGALITYTISWRNTMDTAARSAVIHNVIPAATSYVAGSAEASGGYVDGTDVRWDLGDLAPGASGTVSFQVRVD
jgi:uncharacterized repeat protein (TIGR01451 family)